MNDLCQINITGDIFLKRLADSHRNTELFLEEKFTKRARHKNFDKQLFG